MSEPHPDKSRHGHNKYCWFMKLKIFGFLAAVFCVIGFIGLSYLFMHIRLNTAKMLTSIKKKNKDIAEN